MRRGPDRDRLSVVNASWHTFANSWSKAAQKAVDRAGLAFCGEAGIGKSRLASAAVDLAHGSGAVVLELNGSPFHTDVGLHPMRGLIERALRNRTWLGARRTPPAPGDRGTSSAPSIRTG